MERLCCYANLANLMLPHGCVEHGSPDCVTSWVTWSKNVRYILGPLGKVSLFDLDFSATASRRPAFSTAPCSPISWTIYMYSVPFYAPPAFSGVPLSRNMPARP